MLSTEFQLIHLRDFLHLIGRSVKQISLAICSKNRRDAEDVSRKTGSKEVLNSYLFELKWLLVLSRNIHNHHECNVRAYIHTERHMYKRKHRPAACSTTQGKLGSSLHIHTVCFGLSAVSFTRVNCS